MTPAELGIEPVVRAGRRRIRLAWASETTHRWLPWVGGAAVIIVLLGWIRAWTWPEPAALFAVVCASVALVGAALLLRLPDPVVARALENGLGADDVISTALEIDGTHRFAPRLHERVAQFAPDDAAAAIPLPYRPKVLGLGAALLVAAAVFALVRNPADDDRARREAEAAAIDAVAEQVDEAAEELAQDPATADVGASLEELAAELGELDELEEAIAELEAAADEIGQTDPGELAQRAASLGLERTLESRPLAAGSSAAEQLAALAASADGMSDDELAALAERLAELAETQEAGDPATADALAEAASAAASGDTAGLGAALSQAAASASSSSAAAQAGLAREATADDLRRLAEQLERQQGEGQGQEQGSGEGEGEGQGQGSGQGQGQGSGQGQGQGQGSGQGQGQGQGQGSGQGQGEGSGGGGGMSATGNNPSGLGTGAGGGGQGNGQGNADETGRFSDAEVIVGGESDVLNAGGSATGSGLAEEPGRAQGATTSGQVSVPVREVVTDYRNEAVTALDGLRLAPSEADAVRGYFDALTRSTGAAG